MKRNYLGLACTGHDNALAIVDSQGEIRFAEAAERYLQNKRAFNSPPDDMFRIGRLVQEYCDNDAEIVIAKTWSDESPSRIGEVVGEAQEMMAKYPDASPAWLQNFAVFPYLSDMAQTSINQAGRNVLIYAMNTGRQVSVRAYNHHVTHAAAAAFTSPFDMAACAVIDGFGEGTSTNFFEFKENRLVPLPEYENAAANLSSLGFFYGGTLCSLCGFSGWEGEEWKVMGLAAYGQLDERIYEVMKRCIAVEGLQLAHPHDADAAYAELLSYARQPGAPAETVADLAHTGQYYFGELVTQLLDNLYERGISTQLALGGGCALNSAYVGTITEKTGFDQVYVCSAPADDGNALGAALLAYHEDYPERRRQKLFCSPYLGTPIGGESLLNLWRFGRLERAQECDGETLVKRVANLLAEGKIVGWACGRAEFGPRALGHRSILADPRDPQMKEKINEVVKFREEFRPFAPSILHEFGPDYFENYQESPYMERTLRFRKEVCAKVPAVVHADGTGRLQTVKEEWDPDYYRLIKKFYELTDVPILLNTSFNVMGKPIVHRVEDALAVFFTSGLDALVIENMLVEKPC